MSTTSDYWVGPEIGQGAFAQVLYGQHKTTGRKVAIKIMEQVTLKKHPAAMQALLNERKLLHELADSPYVINLWASFYDSQCVYLVLELAQGGDLMGLIRLGLLEQNVQKWQEESIPYYAGQLVQAIQYMHSELRMVHCDLKPQNIVCSKDGQLQLADFASAVKMDELQPPAPRGTSEYAPPELLRTESNLTTAVDVWSLGCIFYCMFRGQSPFHADSEALTIQAICNYEVASASLKDGKSYMLSNLAQLPEQWRETVHGLVHVDATKRNVAWNTLLSSPPILTIGNKPKNLLLPTATWEQEVELATLKDGALGWGAYLL